jgi:hypothetical protein
MSKGARDRILQILKINGIQTQCVKFVSQTNNSDKVVLLLVAFVHFLPIGTSVIEQ